LIRFNSSKFCECLSYNLGRVKSDIKSPHGIKQN
jgi:hypothetical protein